MNGTYNPWKDIVPYTIDDTHSFRGRDEEKRYFLSMMGDADFSVLYAQSGIGKTSFINAGLYPELKKKGFLFIRIVFPTDILTSHHDTPYEFFEKWFKEQIFKQIPNDIQKIHKNTHNDDILTSSLWWNLHSIELIETLPDFPAKTIKPYLIFDQFEEVFQKANKDNLYAIFTIIEELTGERPPEKIINAIEKNEEEGIYLSYNQGFNYKILFSLRKEYLADFDYWTNEMNSIPQLLRNRMLLLPFTEEQAKEVITQQTHDGKRISVFDNVVNDILTLFKNRNIKSRDSGKYEAFLLSVVCSRLYFISNALGNKLLSSDEVKRIDPDKLLLDFYDERITSIGIPIKHLKIIENELIDDFGERNRVNVNAIKLSAIDFQSKYEKPLEDAHLIRWSSDGYIELIHDKIAELINHRRKQKRLHSWNVVQRIGICALLLLSIIAIVRLGWSTAHGKTEYLTQEDMRQSAPYKASKAYTSTKATWPNDFRDNIISNSLIRTLEINTNKTVKWKSHIDIKNCPFLEEIRIKGNGQLIRHINISDCGSLSVIELPDSIDYIPDIDNCPHVNYIKLPAQFKNNSDGININPTGNFTIEVPEKLKDHFKWHEGILWDIKENQICFADKKIDSVILFPQELRSLDTLRFNGRILYNGAGRNEPYFYINDLTLEKVNLFDMKNVKLDLRNDERTKHLKIIGAEAFANCKELESIVLPNSITEIGDCAFWQCSKLRSIEFSKELTNIANFAFYGCSKIDSLYLPEKISSIGYSSFAMCKNLRVVRLPPRNVDWKPIPTMVPGDRVIFKEATAFDGCNNIGVFYRNDSTLLTNLHIIKEGNTYVYYNLSNKDNLPNGFIIKDSTLYYRFIGLNSIVSYRGTKEVRTYSCVYNPKDSCFVDHPLFRGDLSNLHNIHISEVNYRGIVPNILAKELDISVPYHCRKNYISGYNSFRTIKEDSFYLRIWNQFKIMYSATIYSLQYIGILSYIGLLLVFSTIFYFIYKKVKHTQSILNDIVKTILAVLCFLFIWIVSYWPIFFLWIRTGLGSDIVGMILGLIFGIIIAILFTWILVFDTKTDVFVMLSKLWLQIYSLTLKDVINKIKGHKLITLLLTIIILILATIVRSLSYNENLLKKEGLTKQDLKKMSIYIIRTHRQKKELSERICKEYNFRRVKETPLEHNGHSSQVNYVSFSPDDSILASASEDGTVKLWRIESKKEIRTFYHENSVNCVSFSPNGKIIMSASDDHTARVWDTENGDLLQLQKHDGDVTLSIFSPDGKYAVTASDNSDNIGSNTVKIWDTNTWNNIYTFKTKTYQTPQVKFSPDSKFIAYTSKDSTYIMDIINHHRIKAYKYGRNINYTEFSHDGKSLLATTDREIILKNIETENIEKYISKYELISNGGDIKSATFSRDDNQILISREHSIELFDLKNNNCCFSTHNKYIPYTTFDHKYQHIVHTSYDGYIRLWSITNSQTPIWESMYTNYKGIDYLAKSNIAVLNKQDSIEIWNITSTLNKKYAFATALYKAWAISNDGSYIIRSIGTDSLKLTITKRNQEVWTSSGYDDVKSLSFSPNHRDILVESRDSIFILDVNNGRRIYTFENALKGDFSTYSPKGTYIVTINYNIVSLYSNNGKQCKSFPHDNFIHNLVFSTNEKTLYCITYNKLYIWDTSTGSLTKTIDINNDNGELYNFDDLLIVSDHFTYNIHSDLLDKRYLRQQYQDDSNNNYFRYSFNKIYPITIQDIMKGNIYNEYDEYYEVLNDIKVLAMINKKRFIYLSNNNEAIECHVLSLHELIRLAKHKHETNI